MLAEKIRVFIVETCGKCLVEGNHEIHEST